MVEAINQSLEYARLELLDMGMRGNTLLNFQTRAKTLSVFDEKSTEIYNILVTNQKSMTFAPLPDELVEKKENGDPLPPLPQILEEMHGAGRYTDTKLQTKLSGDDLDKRLLRISTEANTYYQEQGVEILYLALGFLNWYEDKNSDVVRKAPLILIPVELQRSSARERFKLQYTQNELGPNLTLISKMKSFGLTIPEFDEDLDVSIYLKLVASSIERESRWSVKPNEIQLGFFSFGKFQMYQDLDPKKWPSDKNPAAHKVLQSLLGQGFNSAKSESSGAAEHDDVFLADLVDLHFVKDADSSQTEAVLAVKNGSNLVIQGPPGTGKSQTITNIISESLADGKKILFVAEKMAALEVVKRRLDESQIGDAALELHSHKSNKKAVLAELKHTLELGPPKTKSNSREKHRYLQQKARLDAYCDAVNAPILNSQTSYIDALGKRLKLDRINSEHSLPELEIEGIKDWTHNDFLEARSHVIELAEHLDSMGAPNKNAFAKSLLENFSPIDQNKIVKRLAQTRALLASCIVNSENLAKEMALQSPSTLSDIYTLNRAASRAVDAPHLTGLSLSTDDWQLRRDKIEILLNTGKDISGLVNKRRSDLIDQAWEAQLVDDRSVWSSVGKKWWRFLSSDFRKSKQKLQGFCKTELPGQADDCIALIDDILEYQTKLKIFSKNERMGESLFGAQWQAGSSDWGVLKQLSDWVIATYDEVGKGRLPQGLLRFLEGNPSVSNWSERLERLDQDSIDLEKQIEQIIGKLASPLTADVEGGIENFNLVNLGSQLLAWQSSIDDLYQMTRYNRLTKNLNRSGLSEVSSISFSWGKPAKLLVTMLDLSWYSELVAAALSEREPLLNFDRISQESAISEFKRLDKQLFEFAEESLVANHFSNMPSAGGAGEMAIIRREMNKKTRHMPIRKLISQAGRAIQAIKPIFMMSPMSVATYLEQGATDFDLVIFDEASQVKVVDALVPILRGKQVIVVGDTKQMPPTDFFSKALELDDEEAEQSQTADIESILGLFLAQGAPEKMLKWHYRSRHDSLIAVSNEEFYEGKLKVFPSPGINSAASGLKLRYIPDAIYERGTSSTNPIEARVVAEAVMEHARKRSHLTLGVVAFSTKQRDCILLEIERLRRANPSSEQFFRDQQAEGESFFVKNLENVQGDERDIIMISIAYGRMNSGRVSQAFGPVNREGGERRLNVLITRARLGMEVFSNFLADDLKISADTKLGLRALKNFLKFAETGELETKIETGKDTDSPFEDEVKVAIERLGYEVEPQVGSAGFFIDLAVRDPEKPGRYILAVECDGATYHSSANARDRDRLRQDVLEGLGWKFHRIWSTDWFRNPFKETERLGDAISQAITLHRQLEPFDDDGPDNESQGQEDRRKIEREVKPGSTNNVAQPYKMASGNLGLPHNQGVHEFSPNVVNRAVCQILDVEGPVHIDEAMKRITECAGYSKVGHRIKTHLNRAIRTGVREGAFYLEDDFLHQDASRKTIIRDRSELQSKYKSIELISFEERKMAIMSVVKDAFSLTKHEAISAALSLMGIKRVTQKAKDLMRKPIERLVEDGKIQHKGGLIYLQEC